MGGGDAWASAESLYFLGDGSICVGDCVMCEGYDFGAVEGGAAIVCAEWGDG